MIYEIRLGLRIITSGEFGIPENWKIIGKLRGWNRNDEVGKSNGKIEIWGAKYGRRSKKGKEFRRI